MGKKEVQDRRYTDEFKIEAVRLAESIGGNQAAKRLGMPESSLHNWVRLKSAGKLRALNGAAVSAKRPVSELEAENARLRRELASAKLDLEIVKNRPRACTSLCVETGSSILQTRMDSGRLLFGGIRPR